MKTDINSEFIYKNSELLISSFVIAACLFLSVVFPVNSSSLAQLLTKQVFFLIIIPALYIKLVLKKKLSSFGLNLKNKKTGIFSGIIALFALVIIYYLFFQYTSLEKKYVIPELAANYFPYFIAYELILVNVLFFSYEFFFRGFVLFLFSEKLGQRAILLQAILFTIFFSISFGFFWQYCVPVIFSLAGGFIAYRSKSFIFPYITSLLFAIVMNSYVIYSLKKW